MPSAARAHTDAGAEAFVRFYIDQLNLAWTEPLTGLLPPLSDPGCRSCAAFERTAEKLVAEGHHYAQSPVTVTSVSAYGGARPGRQLLRLLGRQNKVTIVDHAGVGLGVDAQKDLKLDVLVKWGGTSWVVLDLG